jgi:hypothetical protein
MTRKLLMTVAIVAIALAPSIGVGTARPVALAEAVSTAAGLTAAAFTAGMAAVFTAGIVASSIRVTMDMAIPHIVTTAIDRVAGSL